MMPLKHNWEPRPWRNLMKEVLFILFWIFNSDPSFWTLYVKEFCACSCIIQQSTLNITWMWPFRCDKKNFWENKGYNFDIFKCIPGVKSLKSTYILILLLPRTLIPDMADNCILTSVLISTRVISVHQKVEEPVVIMVISLRIYNHSVFATKP